MTLKANYLSKKGGQWRTVKLIDIVTLIHNVIEGSRNPEVGFEDARETYDTLLKRLNHKALLDPNILESALWSCNLMDEGGMFWDTRGRSFAEFIKDLLPAEKFDRFYNYIKKKESLND